MPTYLERLPTEIQDNIHDIATIRENFDILMSAIDKKLTWRACLTDPTNRSSRSIDYYHLNGQSWRGVTEYILLDPIKRSDIGNYADRRLHVRRNITLQGRTVVKISTVEERPDKVICKSTV